MDWAAIWRDIVIGLLIAGALAAWVPISFWQSFFLVDHPTLAKIWDPRRAAGCGDLVRLLDRERPAGGGALERRDQLRRRLSFIFADLIILPILNIYRKYYGIRMTRYLWSSST